MIDLLAFLSDRDNYTKYRGFIKENILTKESSTITADMNKWWDVSTEDSIDWEEFSTWFFVVAHPTMKEDRAEIFQKIFDKLSTHEIDSELSESLLNSFIARDFATQVYKIAQDVAEGVSGDIDQVTTVMESYYDTLGSALSVDSYEAEWDIHEIMASTVGGTGLNWRLPPFNKSLGPLRKGDFIIIGARPDTGKTTMLASEVTFMAAQLPPEKQVLWFNNEETGAKVQLRILQAALGWNSEEIELDMSGAMAEYTALMGRPDKIKVFDKATLSVKDVHEACKKYDGGLLIFDQLWKLHGVREATNDVHKMTLLFNYGREWAKEYAPVLTVHQADGSAGGQEYLTMEQLYMSKTGVQGEADAIIMIGRSYDSVKADSRFISVPKNKLTGGPSTVPSMRNMQIEVVIHPEIARFEEAEEI